MKIYVLGVPHTICDPEWSTCAFTMKAYHLCRMMHDRGHEVIFMGVEGSTPQCSENVPLVKRSLWEQGYSHPGKDFYDLGRDGAKGYILDEFARRAREELEWRRGERQTEIVCCPWGTGHQDCVRDIEPHQFVVESGIGYPHIFSQFRVYESYAWMHMHMGRDNQFDGRKWYFAVIPNAIDVDALSYCPSQRRGDHFLYMGRLIGSKGVGIAVDVARECGRRITICGQGDPEPFLRGNDHVDYHPPVGVKERGELLSRARLLMAPTEYVEPWGGVTIEAMATGCPVITTDWGGFAETVLHGITGYRCRTFEQFVFAAKRIEQGHIDSDACHDWAVNNFSLSRVGQMYEEYFQSLLDLKSDKGWYTRRPNRKHLDWLRKRTPMPIFPCVDHSTSEVSKEVAPASQHGSDWKKAQKWEKEWWGDDPNSERWAKEAEKQKFYAEQMLLTPGIAKDKSVLDMGGGPISMLLWSRHGKSVVVDPMPVQEGRKEHYHASGIEYIHSQGEDYSVITRHDEGWMYNCLQHTTDPKLVLLTLTASCKLVRIFEWLHTPRDTGHPQSLDEMIFRHRFYGAESQWRVIRWHRGVQWGTDFLAIVAERNEEELA